MNPTDPSFEASRKRAADSLAERLEVRHLVAAGRWREADGDSDRTRAYIARRVARRTPPGAESLQGPTVDLQGVTFLGDGARVARAVGYVEVNDARSCETGTGFLISPRLFITNQHVIRDANAALAAQVAFDRELDHDGRPRATTSYLLDPTVFALFSPVDQLDYAIVALGRRLAGQATPEDLGCCVLSARGDKHAIGMNVNIIQHPQGLPKMVALRNNLLSHRDDKTLLYETDTQAGSSGSPVFNDDWDLVALHHWGQPFLAAGVPAGTAENEGVRISAIVADLVARAPSLPPTQRALLAEALAAGSAAPTPSAVPVRSLSQAHPATSQSHPITSSGAVMPTSLPAVSANQVSITVPLVITVQLGNGVPISATTTAAPSVAGSTPVRTLQRGPEARRLDRTYSGRSGFAANFIPGHTIAKPAIGPDLKEQVAPLRAGEPHATEGELTYEHFSVILHKARRMAIYTATNIDGAAYLAINRATGEPASEGDTWFKDPRVSEGFYLGQEFYGAWSTYFDRGHLTRRSDPTWGTPEESKRANADTFHFTNCSPQHFRFNQSSAYWQGAERYVLENGLLQAESRQRLSVFQGPIFDDRIDRWADDVQIPSSFFKIVVWRGQDRLRAVGLVVDQSALLDEPRHYLGQPQELASVDVAQWRVAIPEIERRTGLDFGDAVRAADTISRPGQPQVGAEAARPLRSLADILA